jgi:transposase
MANEFWLSDSQWARIEELLPRNQPGARRTDDYRVISGIIHVLKSGCPWRNCPSVYGPYTTIYNRWNRWSQRGIWDRLFEALREFSLADEFQAIDSTTTKAHRSAAGGKGGPTRRRSADRAEVERPKSMRSVTPKAVRSHSK